VITLTWLPRRAASLLRFIVILWITVFATTCGYDVHAGVGSGYDAVVGAACNYDAATTLAGEERSSTPPGEVGSFPHSARFVAPNSSAGAGRPTTTILSDVTVVSRGRVVGRGDVYLRPTLEGIESGRITPRDIFQNREGLLPQQPSGYYHEFVHPMPGVSGAGSQRIIRGGGGELY
jgi:filamentous hemagglutinin